MIVPTTVMSFVHGVPQENEQYSEETLREAWGAMISIFLLMGLSVVFLLYFHPEDALAAMVNDARSQTDRASSIRSMLQDHQERVDDDEIVEVDAAANRAGSVGSDVEMLRKEL